MPDEQSELWKNLQSLNTFQQREREREKEARNYKEGLTQIAIGKARMLFKLNKNRHIPKMGKNKMLHQVTIEDEQHEQQTQEFYLSHFFGHINSPFRDVGTGLGT